MSIEEYFSGKSAWIGSKPVHISEAIELVNAPNYRASHTMHGKFDRVWLYEVELFSYGPSWPLLVDEGIRLLGSRGQLIVRTRDSRHGTLFELKSLIARRPSMAVELAFQQKLPNGHVVSVIDVQRENFLAYTDDSWTVGILSNGAKSANVFSLVEKVVQLAGDRQLQILIAGPEKLLLPTNVRGACQEWRDHSDDELPRIGEKKNWIVRQAINSNIAIFHDRYQIDDNFFDGFNEFGLDFDFVSIPQRYESGAYYPSYIGFPEYRMRWQRPVFDPSYRTLHDGHFINGGLIILKRHIADVLNFNPLLLHNEAEDVELGFHFRSHGIVPRMNIHSSAHAIGVPDTYTASFRKLVSQPQPDPGHLRVRIGRVALAVWSRLPFWVKKLLQNTRFYAVLQRYLRPD